jgi:MFS family permease
MDPSAATLELQSALRAVTCANAFGFQCSLISRNELLLRFVHSAPDLPSILTTAASTAAVIELLGNPMVGKIADAYGRRLPMIVAAAVSLILRCIVVVLPTSFSAILAERIIGQFCTATTNTLVSALLSDCFEGEQLALAATSNRTFLAIGSILGPLVGGRLAALTKTPQHAYMLGCCSALVPLYIIVTCVREKYHPPPLDGSTMLFDMETCNPFLFVNLLASKWPHVRGLSWIAALQMMVLNKNILDVTMAYARNQLQWQQGTLLNFVAYFGVCFIGSHVCAKYNIQKLGVQRFTTLSNSMSALGFFLWFR